jgi:hypothetical protein
MEDAQVLAALYAIRTNPAYRAAEILRLRTKGGAEARARAEKTSDEYGAILLLVNTWETISSMLRHVSEPTREKVFAVTPLAQMHEALRPAIDALGSGCPGFADDFGDMSRRHREWLGGCGKGDYVSGNPCGGLQAFFG